MVHRFGLWLLTTLLLTVHLVCAWGYYRSAFSPAGWEWVRANLPSHGFIDPDAVRRANQWVLSHHDRWVGPLKPALSIEGQMSDGAQLSIGESMKTIALTCSGDQIQLVSSHKSTVCAPQLVTSDGCHFESSWTIRGNEWLGIINGQQASCIFEQDASKEPSDHQWTLGSGVRPIWITRINGEGVLGLMDGLILSVIVGVGIWWLRSSRTGKLLLLTTALTVPIPLLSPEWIAVTFRAPAWNHWGLGLYLNLILFFIGVIWQRTTAHTTRLRMFMVGIVSIVPVLLAHNTDPISILAFAALFTLIGFVKRAVEVRSSLQFCGLVLLGLFCLEWASRNSDTGDRWLRDLGYANATMAALSDDEQKRLIKLQDEHAIFQADKFQDYPTFAFPVAYPEKGHLARIVAMGGSSTGGAYQMDDLSRFYPAVLENALDERFEVLNQGVGGWTSFHIRRYLKNHIESLRPDILTLYISNNDAAKNLPADIESIYRRMDDNLSPSTPISLFGPIQSVHRLVWLSERVAAVPPERMGHNIEQIAALIPVENRRILLMTELNHPDSKRLEIHHQRLVMMAEQLEGVELWDGRALQSELKPNFFLDQVHLSDEGHQWLANALLGRLNELGWLE